MPRVILTLLVLGAVIYLLVRLVQGRGGGGGSGGSGRRPRSVAPDDDPGFLRDLDDKLWQERQGNGDSD
jgi:hypothetical protein